MRYPCFPCLRGWRQMARRPVRRPPVCCRRRSAKAASAADNMRAAVFFMTNAPSDAVRLRDQAEPGQPRLDVRVVVGGQAFRDGCVRQISRKMCRLLSIGSLALVQKGIRVLPKSHRRKGRSRSWRGFVPPDGIAHENRVVIRHVVHADRNFRPRAVLNLRFRLLLQVAIVLRALDLGQCAAGQAGDLLRDGFGVAGVEK